MSHLSGLEADIIKLGLFVVFLITFRDYVYKKIKPIIKSCEHGSADGQRDLVEFELPGCIGRFPGARGADEQDRMV